MWVWERAKVAKKTHVLDNADEVLNRVLDPAETDYVDSTSDTEDETEDWNDEDENDRNDDGGVTE